MPMMGSILKLRYRRLDHTVNSSDDDKMKDHAVVAEDINNLNLNDEDVLTSKSGEDAHAFRSAQVIIDEKNSRKSEKRPLDEDYIVSNNDYEEDQESSDKKRQKLTEKKTKVPRKRVQLYDLPSELPQNFQEYISGLNLEVPPLFVAQKLLTVTDITSGQGRLLLPRSLINAEFFDNFLTENEKELVGKKQPVEVNLVDAMMREYHTLHMTQWDMNSSSPIVLRRAWKNVVEENKLKRVMVWKVKEPEPIVGIEDDDKLVTDVVARVWCFRRESKIWFALNIQAMAEVKILGRTNKGCYLIE